MVMGLDWRVERMSRQSQTTSTASHVRFCRPLYERTAHLKDGQTVPRLVPDDRQ